MRLIVNFGNSDLKLFCKNSGDAYVFRKREKYFSSLSDLVDSIKKYDVKFDSNGNVLTKAFIKINENNETKEDELERIEFPILKDEIKKIEELEKRKITEVLCFITKQKESKNTDTFLLKEILLGTYGKIVFPNIEFKFATITVNPADYSIILPLYSKFISKINLDDTVISIAQGTPAMCLGLSQSCARVKPDINQYYASNSHETDKATIKKLDIFSKEEKLNSINQLAVDLKNGNYDIAKAKVENSYLSTFPYILDILDYFIYRKNYQFKEALDKLNSLSEKNHSFDEIIKPIKLNLEYIIQADPENFNYSNPKCPFLLLESLANIQLSLNKKDYFNTMALLISFLDVLGNYVMLKALGLESLTFKKGIFEEVNEYIRDNIKLENLSKNKYDKLILAISKPEGIHFVANFSTRRQLIHWVVSNKDNVPEFVQMYFKLDSKYKAFIPFASLRNKLPIAHSVKGISLEAINMALNDNKNNTAYNIFGLIEELYNLVEDSFAISKIYAPYYLDSDKFISIIKKLIL